MEAFAPGCVGPHPVAVESSARREGEVLIRHLPGGYELFNLTPNLLRQSIGARAPDNHPEPLKHRLSRLTAGTVHAYFRQECDLILSPIDRQVPAVPIPRFAYSGDAPLNP